MRLLESDANRKTVRGPFDRMSRCPIRVLMCAMLAGLGMPTEGHATEADARSLNDGPNGVTCANYSLAGRLAWQRRLGDWLDRNGEKHGEAEFGLATAGRANLSDGIRIDVTPLARMWLSGERANTGVLLRSLAGQGIMVFQSREHEKGPGPLLELEWSDRASSRHGALADTTLDCSTFRSIGRSQTIRVGPDKNALIVFDLPPGDAEALASATIVLSPTRLFGRTLQIGVFSPQPPWAAESVPLTNGLAAAHPMDKRLGNHPDVLYFADFERDDWLSDWNRLTASEMSVVESDPENDFKPLQGRALRTTLKQGKNTALNLRYLFAKHGDGSEPEEIYFRYYLRMGDDWNPDVEGGKLPGIAGTYGRGGWGMRPADGTNGWSVRGAFSSATPAKGDTPLQTPVGSYVYHADMRGHSGHYWGWNRGPGGLLQNNRWYAVEQYLKLNTPGEKNGIFKAWIDGHLVYERSKLNFRTINDLRIESIWLNVYHGGVKPSPRDMSLYIDNVVIARKYIGPITP